MKLKHITAPSRIRDTKVYYLRRSGGWFRELARGYTEDIAEAGVFTPDVVRDYLHKVGGVTAIEQGSMRDEIWREVQASLARAAKLSEIAINLVQTR